MFRPAVLIMLVLVPFTSLAGEPTVADLGWLAGCWSSDGREAESGEQWMAPAGGTMLGVARTVRDSKTVAYEFLRIQEKDGTLVYVASPSGQSTTEFPLERITEDEVVFANPEHDFPQRIAYRRASDTSLLARIEGTVDGELRGIDFPMTRVACP